MVSTNTSQKPYFGNLDALRFMAAFVVLISHCVSHFHYQFNSRFAEILHKHLFLNGPLGVTFFFVLSGFLISWLLLREKEKNKNINLPYFYLRRILRIWPVYLIVVAAGFLVSAYARFSFIDNSVFTYQVPSDQFKWYIFFLANFNPDEPSLLVSSLWSVAVEEQFYLFWPLMLAAFHRKVFPYCCTLIILISFVFRAFFTTPATNHLATHLVMSELSFGGLICYYSLYSKTFLSRIENLQRKIIIALYCILFSYVFLHGFSRIFGQVFYRIYAPFEPLAFSALFGFVILEQNFCKNSVFKFGSLGLLTRLGKISYGIYSYHMLAFPFAFFVSDFFGLETGNIGHYLVKSLIVILLTLIFSGVSYVLIEKRFLKLKEKFSKI